MRIIPKKTNVSMEFFNGFTAGDIAVGFIGALVEVALLVSNLPGKYYLMSGGLVIIALLLLKMDDERTYIFLLSILRHFAYRRKYVKDMPKGKKADRKREDIRKVIAYTGIQDNFILYDGKYYGAVLELPSVEFRFFSEYRQNNAIEKALGGVLRNVNPNYAANLVKIERPVLYDDFVRAEQGKIESLQDAYRRRVISGEELKRRVEIIYDRIHELEKLSFENKVVLPSFYLVLFDSDKGILNNQVTMALDLLQSGEIQARRLGDRELAVFLKYTQTLDFDERDALELEGGELYEFSLPESLEIYARNLVVNHILNQNFRVVGYPMTVANAWGAFVFDTPATKVVMKMKPLDRAKAIRSIDRSIDELRSQENSTGKASRLIDISTHIDTLSELLVMLQNDNEILMDVNIYVTGYDLEGSLADPRIAEKPENSALSHIANMKKSIRRIYNDANLKLNNMMFMQMDAWIAGQVSGYDPRGGRGRAIHSSSVAAVFPFVYTYTADSGGINLGRKNGIPVFIDFFRRDDERVNSNMAIIGKSGSGKSYATKTLLANLAAENSKIFVLDPENEYTELARNLGGKIINVGNATHGRLNPFQIITNLEDDEEGGEENAGAGVSFHTHLQFLEEFFKQILPDIEPDALEYLNNLIIRIYSLKGIEEHTDLSRLKPEDYPVFDDLYDTILEEFQSTKSDYLKSNLQILINYVAKFSSGGRNSVLWNGHSTISTEENFIVFNFQSLLANRNNLIANAQMLLVLKWLDNEIIKNRDYNIKYHASRKIVVVIDEAHVFIDTKYPLALDFMFQLAKRIRKYNGMQIVITQNIKDFVGSEEIARKSTAIINACQYSLIFALAPNDMHDLCRLYEKAGQINEQEQEEIINASRGQAFVITSPSSRSSLQVEARENVRRLFSDREFISPYFAGEKGEALWQEVLGQAENVGQESAFAEPEEAVLSGIARLEELEASGLFDREEEKPQEVSHKRVKIVEISEEEIVPPKEETARAAFPAVEEGDSQKAYSGRGDGVFGMPYPERQTGGPGQSAATLPTGGQGQNSAGFQSVYSQNMIEELRESIKRELMEELRASFGFQAGAGQVSGMALGDFGRAAGTMAGTYEDESSRGDFGRAAGIMAGTSTGESTAALEGVLPQEQEAQRMEEEFYRMFRLVEEDRESGMMTESAAAMSEKYGAQYEEDIPAEEESFDSYLERLFEESQTALYGEDAEGAGNEYGNMPESGSEYELPDQADGETESGEDALVWDMTFEELMKCS